MSSGYPSLTEIIRSRESRFYRHLPLLTMIHCPSLTVTEINFVIDEGRFLLSSLVSLASIGMIMLLFCLRDK